MQGPIYTRMLYINGRPQPEGGAASVGGGGPATGLFDWRESVIDKDLAAPPGAPAANDRYIVAAPAVGAWAGREDDIAEWDGLQWLFEIPDPGFATYVEDEELAYFYNGTAWEKPEATTGIRKWGAGTVGATTDLRYLFPEFENALAPTSAIQTRAARPGLLRKARLRHNGTAGNGNAIVYTVRKNGVATALSVSLASTVSDGQDLANTVSYNEGDYLDVEVTKAAGIGTSPTDIVLEVEDVSL